MKNWVKKTKNLILISLFVVSSTVAAFPTDMDGNLLVTDKCKAKGDVTLFSHQYREKITQELALQVLDRDWKKVWSKKNLGSSTRVDMERIVRDVFRKDPIPKDQHARATMEEIVQCMNLGY